MANLNEVSSLLQLGVGIGIGLSVFRAPLDIRVTIIETSLKRERTVLSKINTASARAKLKELSSLELLFIDQKSDLSALQPPILVATVAVAFANLLGLIWASLDASHILTKAEICILLFITVGYYLGAALFLELAARLKMAQVTSRLATLQSN